MALFFGMHACSGYVEQVHAGHGELVFVMYGVCHLQIIVSCYHYCVVVCHKAHMMNL